MTEAETERMVERADKLHSAVFDITSAMATLHDEEKEICSDLDGIVEYLQKKEKEALEMVSFQRLKDEAELKRASMRW